MNLGLTFLLELFTKIDSDLFNAEFDTNKLFDRLGLSKSHANRKIKSITKLSPNQLLQELRLRHSLKLLRAADLSISEIAYDCGFNSPDVFYKGLSQEIWGSTHFFCQVKKANGSFVSAFGSKVTVERVISI